YIAMRYCEPYWWAQPHAVDVLLDGATYTRYWDWPTPQSYSVVDRILGRGRATLSYDRTGSGLSRPPAGPARHVGRRRVDSGADPALAPPPALPTVHRVDALLQRCRRHPTRRN